MLVLDRTMADLTGMVKYGARQKQHASANGKNEGFRELKVYVIHNGPGSQRSVLLAVLLPLVMLAAWPRVVLTQGRNLGKL